MLKSLAAARLPLPLKRVFSHKIVLEDYLQDHINWIIRLYCAYTHQLLYHNKQLQASINKVY